MLAVLAVTLASNANAMEAGDGGQLAARYCANCHQLPQPDVLSVEAWRYALDLMGLYLGYDDGGLLAGVVDAEVRRQLFDLDRYPVEPVLGRDDWQRLRDYYELSEGAGAVPVPPAGETLTLFEPSAVYINALAPVTSLVQVNARGDGFLLGDGRDAMLRRFNAEGVLVESSRLPGIPVQLDDNGVSRRVTLIGSLSPSNAATGAIAEMRQPGQDWQPLVTQLHRPVSAIYADFDLDGDEDVLVCEFGHYVGRLALYERNAGAQISQMKRHVLSQEPGAVVARTLDPGDDGLLDAIVLKAQAREGVVLFKNLGGFRFERKVLVEQHPGFGYTDMHLADFTADGQQELLLVNGDNGDLPGPPLKAYHGLRIYRMLRGGGLEQ